MERPLIRLWIFSGERLELRGGVGGIDVVGTKEHQFTGGKPVAERSKTQLIVVVILTIDDDAVDIDTGVEYGQLTAGRQLPQTYTAVRRTTGHELVARRYARAQHLKRRPLLSVLELAVIYKLTNSKTTNFTSLSSLKRSLNVKVLVSIQSVCYNLILAFVEV